MIFKSENVAREYNVVVNAYDPVVNEFARAIVYLFISLSVVFTSLAFKCQMLRLDAYTYYFNDLWQFQTHFNGQPVGVVADRSDESVVVAEEIVVQPFGVGTPVHERVRHGQLRDNDRGEHRANDFHCWKQEIRVISVNPLIASRIDEMWYYVILTWDNIDYYSFLSYETGRRTRRMW